MAEEHDAERCIGCRLNDYQEMVRKWQDSVHKVQDSYKAILETHEGTVRKFIELLMGLVVVLEDKEILTAEELKRSTVRATALADQYLAGGKDEDE